MATSALFGRGRGWLAVSMLIVIGGCSDKPKMFPVQGKLVFDNGKIQLLAGSVLVCQQQQEPFLQASGDIQEDGTFKLQTHFKGEVLPGAAPGNYRAWIELSTDNGSKEQLIRALGIDRRYLSSNSKSSSLIFMVPSPQELVLTVTEAQAGDLPEVTPPWAAFPKCGEPADPESSAGDGL